MVSMMMANLRCIALYVHSPWSCPNHDCGTAGYLTGTYPKPITSLTGHQEKVPLRAAGDGRGPEDAVSEQPRGRG